MRVPFFNMSTGFVLDVMHAAFIGVTAKIFHELLDASQESDFKFLSRTPVLDAAIAVIKWPNHANRGFRGLREVADFKSTDWENYDGKDGQLTRRLWCWRVL